VIVMNAVTGEVLAMANDPSYNPNDRTAPADHRRNRAVTDGYEPGSTMKAVLLASALSNGMKLSDQVFGEHGKFKLQGRTISEAETKEKFDWISLKKIIQVSSNIGAAKLALKVGADRYFNTLKGFGFASKTGIGFPGEISGRVPPRKSWQPLTLANIGFGQGVLVTPIQMVRAYAAFLNGGWLVEPSLIRDSVEKPAPPKRILSPRVCEQVLEALESVTQKDGTGEKANLPGYRVAGKTGTAQKVDPATGAYSRSKHIASFIGYALDVEPKLVIYTMLDEPKGSYYAAETAVPLFHEVLSDVANRYSLPGRRLAQDEEAPKGAPKLAAAAASSSPRPHAMAGWAEPPQLDPAQELAKTGPLEWIGTEGEGHQVWRMPLLKGLTAREAMQRLKGHSFQLELEGSGVIHSQYPAEGKSVADGETVKLGLSETN
jgi:cell division protein FtsI (penicillin-binding protein 3)